MGSGFIARGLTPPTPRSPTPGDRVSQLEQDNAKLRQALMQKELEVHLMHLAMQKAGMGMG